MLNNPILKNYRNSFGIKDFFKEAKKRKFFKNLFITQIDPSIDTLKN